MADQSKAKDGGNRIWPTDPKRKPGELDMADQLESRPSAAGGLTDEAVIVREAQEGGHGVPAALRGGTGELDVSLT
jgi:hypothetical protein